MHLNYLNEVAITNDEDFIDKDIDDVYENDDSEYSEYSENSEGSNDYDEEKEEEQQLTAEELKVIRQEHKQLKEKIDYYNTFMADNYKNFGVNDLESFEKKYKEDLAKIKQQEIEEAYINLNKKGVSKEEIEEILSKLPQMQEVDKYKAENKRIHDFDEFRQEFPEFQKMEDMKKLPKDAQDKLIGYVAKGYSLKEAYILSNYQNIQKGVQQQVMNNLNGKSHLKGISSSSAPLQDDIQSIDPVQLQWYKKLNPNATEEQIIKHYKQSMKEERSQRRGSK